MTRLIYNLVWPIGFILFLPAYLLKMFQRGGYRRHFGQRFGVYGRDKRKRLRGIHPIWLHAVSVGEVGIALKLARRLQRTQAGLRFVLSTTTTTGYALAEKCAPASMDVIYFPLDFWPIMRRAFRLVSPRAVVLIEGEVWPNLVMRAVRRKIPILLANARLSPRSERRFRAFRIFVAPIFRKLTLICAPTEEDGTRWRQLGATRIAVVGNIKYDVVEPTDPSPVDPRFILEQIGIDPARPVLLGGSTHRGEEQILADAFCCLRQRLPNLFLIVAPRHVERVREIETQLHARNLSVTRLSSCASAKDCLIIDSTGELAHWYKVATVVFIGKSLTAHGGQNPVEPIIASAPVLFGPHMENFSLLADELVQSGGSMRVQNQRELIDETDRLLRDPGLREQRTAAALRAIAPHRGATARTAELIEKVIREAGSDRS